MRVPKYYHRCLVSHTSRRETEWEGEKERERERERKNGREGERYLRQWLDRITEYKNRERKILYGGFCDNLNACFLLSYTHINTLTHSQNKIHIQTQLNIQTYTKNISLNNCYSRIIIKKTIKPNYIIFSFDYKPIHYIPILLQIRSISIVLFAWAFDPNKNFINQ